MGRHTSPPPVAGPDFSPGGSAHLRTGARRSTVRTLGWLLVVAVALVLGLGAGAWWWASGDASLASTLRRAAQFLPAHQQLEARGVTGSLRSGGHIGELRWSSPSLVIQAKDIQLGWQLAPLLQGRLELGELHAAQVQITPQGAPQTQEPPTPPTALELPLHIGLSFRVDQLDWAGAPAVQARDLAGDYRFDGRQHRLNVQSVELAQGRYRARATLDAQTPMALEVTLDGSVHTQAPGSSAPLQIAAHATLKGTLATSAAQLQLQAQLRPEGDAADAPGPPMQADVQAAAAPWATQPLQSVTATLRALNLAALWPQAPTTQLQGTVQAGPTPGTAEAPADWAIGVQLQNTLPGPWDASRLPLTALQANATYDGTRWTLPGASASAGKGSVALQGHYTPATGALEGTAQLRQLHPDALHTALAAAPLSGQISARTQGNAVHFSADIGTAASSTTEKAAPGHPAPLRIRRLTGKGQWQAASSATTDNGTSTDTLQIDRLLIDALQARVEATDLLIHPGAQSAQGQLVLAVPGATARASGQLAAQSGKGDLQVQWADVALTQRWLASLPLIGAALQRTLQSASAQGAAQLTARWSGGWRGLMQPLPRKSDATLQASLSTPRLDLSIPSATGEGGRPTAVQLRGVQASIAGNWAQATLDLNAEARTGSTGQQRLRLQTRVAGGQASAGLWQAQIATLALQAHDTQRPGPWALQLDAPLGLSARTEAQSGTLQLQTSAGQAHLTGPLPGSVALRWQPMRWGRGTGTPLRLQTQGSLQGLPMAWLDALGLNDGAPAVQGSPAQPLLARLGLTTSLLLDGEWNVDMGDTLRASASLRRSSGDLRILAGDAGIATTVQGTASSTAATAGTPAGVRQAELALQAEGNTLRARLVWASERAGEIDASVSTQLALQGNAASLWPADAPLQGQLRARLPDVGVWSALAPPGWRVRGTLDASATLAGTRSAPRWTGTLGADALAVRSIVDGVDLQDGRLRATLGGDRIDITEFQLKGGRGSRARIAGLSGNRTAAPDDGGLLTGTGHIQWSAATDGFSGITMDFQAEAKALQVQVRADRQLSVSGPLRAQLQQGQISLHGQLTANRATIILPDESAPSLGSDVVVRSAAKDRTQAQEAATAGAQAQTAKPPSIAVTLNLGNDFALSGHGITTRLAGEVEIRSSTTPDSPPRITGEVQTEQGRYRAWGQMLDVETGLIRFNGPYNNPSLDILALRPHIRVRAGVQVTGNALAPRVKLYSDPELPDAEKLSWVVLGRSAAGGGAEAAVLQQAALALLGRGGTDNTAANAARRLGLDEIGFKGPGAGEDATGAALTFGKRLSKDLYVTYERSLSGTLGTLYIFYDLTRHLTLRGQTGEKSAADLIYTMRYD